MSLILSADRTCDLNEEIFQELNIHTIPYHILLEEKEYLDNVNIAPQDIYNAYYEKKILPKTSAINAGEYLDYFRPFVEQGHDVVHFCLGSCLSSSYQNCLTAAEELGGHVYPIDGRNLSVGVGLQVMDAAELIKKGMNGAELQNYFAENCQCYHTSFVINQMTFLRAGGRCSSLAALSANLLNIHPSIDVDNTSGAMQVAKKYRGSTEKVMKKYVQDKLAQYKDIRTDRIFITNSGIDEKIIKIVEDTVRETLDFDKIYYSVASCTISSHCGPESLGILFATETPAK